MGRRLTRLADQSAGVRKVGIGQAVVSRLEGRETRLLPPSYDYLTATCADIATLVVAFQGCRIELGLGTCPPRRPSDPHVG